MVDDKVKDAGGLLREWARLLIKALGESGLFETSKESEGYLTMCKNVALISGYQEEYKKTN